MQDYLVRISGDENSDLGFRFVSNSYQKISEKLSAYLFDNSAQVNNNIGKQ